MPWQHFRYILVRKNKRQCLGKDLHCLLLKILSVLYRVTKYLMDYLLLIHMWNGRPVGCYCSCHTVPKLSTLMATQLRSPRCSLTLYIRWSTFQVFSLLVQLTDWNCQIIMQHHPTCTVPFHPKHYKYDQLIIYKKACEAHIVKLLPTL